MASGYLQIMEEHLSHLKINRNLANKLIDFANAFINKNDDHINFFGSNLTGVYSIYFTTLETNDLFIDILEGVNNSQIRKQIRKLEAVGDGWVVASEPVTICLLYLIRQFRKSDISAKLLEDVSLACGRIIHFKFLTSLTNHYFPYNVSEPLALAASRAMSRKYTLKQEGTWLKTVDRRVNDFLYNQDTWKKELNAFSPDEDVVKMVSDIQGRMRSMISNIADITYQLNDQGAGIDSDTTQIKTDDGLVIKDVTRLQNEYEDYLLSVLPEPRALIKPELIKLMGKAITTMPEPPLYDVLNSVSMRALQNDKKVINFSKDIIVYLFSYLQEKGVGNTGLNDLSELIEKLKSLITASKSSNDMVLALRKEADRIVKKGTKIRNASSLSGLRTGLILYLIIRTVTKNHYQ